VARPACVLAVAASKTIDVGDGTVAFQEKNSHSGWVPVGHAAS
jgi:hypothetical protein